MTSLPHADQLATAGTPSELRALAIALVENAARDYRRAQAELGNALTLARRHEVPWQPLADILGVDRRTVRRMWTDAQTEQAA